MVRRILIGSIILSLFCGIYSYFRLPFWSSKQINDSEILCVIKSDFIKGIRGKQVICNKDFLTYVSRIEKYALTNEVELIVTQAFRQNGLKVSNQIVSPSLKSNHLIGFALDINIKFNSKIYLSKDLNRKNYNKLPDKVKYFINDVRGDKDLRWGGDFTKEDPVHIDMPVNLNSYVQWKEYYEICQREYIKAPYVWELWK